MRKREVFWYILNDVVSRCVRKSEKKCVMFLTIATPKKIIFEGAIQQVTLPGCDGNFQVLKNHAPITSTLVAGLVTYSNGDSMHELMIEKGVAEVSSNIINLLCSPKIK